MSNWFLTKVKFTKEFQDGTLKRVTEPYLVNAGSFTEAEARVYEDVGEFIRGEFIVNSINRFDVADIFYYEDSEVWFKCKVSYTTEDDNGKEAKVVNTFLVTASDTTEATERVKDTLKGLMSVFEISKVEKTNIVEVLPAASEETEKRKATKKKVVEKEAEEA